jgi:hypothetical protein
MIFIKQEVCANASYLPESFIELQCKKEKEREEMQLQSQFLKPNKDVVLKKQPNVCFPKASRFPDAAKYAYINHQKTRR